MPRLSRRASWKSSRQQDCQEFIGRRAGAMPSNPAAARSLSMPPRRRRAAHVLSSIRDGNHFPRELSDCRAETTPRRSSVRRKVKRWDGIQRATTVWDSLRRVSFSSHPDDLESHSCWNFLLGSRVMVSVRRLPHPFLRSWPVTTWPLLASIARLYSIERLQFFSDAIPTGTGIGEPVFFKQGIPSQFAAGCRL